MVGRTRERRWVDRAVVGGSGDQGQWEVGDDWVALVSFI
jgi:hypothetical protein